MVHGSGLTRRTVLAAAATGLLPAAPVPAAGTVSAVCMATHLHGPFSEGVASFCAHLAQARRYGVDVVWFTDHDWRIAAFQHRQVVHFNGASEPENGLAWTWKTHIVGAPSVATATYVASPHSPDDGKGKALRLTAAGGGALRYTGTAWNSTANTCIADTQLTLDVLPESGTLVLDVQLSNQPGKGVLHVRYTIGLFSSSSHDTKGAVGTVKVPVKAGKWQQLTFPLRDDAAKLWPDIVAADNALTDLTLEVRDAQFVVDRLTFHRSRRAGQAGEKLRAEVVDAAAARYPDITVYRALEVSLVRHLNWFGGDLTLPPFHSPPVRDDNPAATEKMVTWLHSHGGLVCLNHPMDVATRTELANLLVQRDALGVDLLEIGRKPVEDLLWVYDVTCRNLLFCTAIGGSDDHTGADWATNDEHNVTYVWSRSKSRTDLLLALQAGAAWFTDLTAYRGTLDLRIGGASRMGAVLISTYPVQVSVVATKLPAGATLEVVTGACTPGTTPATTIQRDTNTVTLQPNHYVRTQVRLKGTVVGASNPLWLLARPPAHPIPPARRLTTAFSSGPALA